MTKAEIVAALREKTRLLYEGKLPPHRSCEIALAHGAQLEPTPLRL